MIIVTRKLKELVDQALLEDRKKWDDEEVNFVARKAKHREDWLAKYGQDWLAACEKIKQKIAAGEPITKEDMPGDGTRWHDPAFFSEQRPDSRHEKDIVAGKAVYKAPRDLLEFQRFLELVDGDTVSTSALKDHGLVNLQTRILQFLHDSVER